MNDYDGLQHLQQHELAALAEFVARLRKRFPD